MLYFIKLEAHPHHLSTIEGIIIEKESKEPIPYISISLEGTQHQTMSEDDGTFVLKDIHAGKYIIHVHSLGYLTFRKEIDIKPNVIEEIKIELTTDSKELSEVHVMGSLSRMQRETASIVTSHLTTKNFEATHSNTLSQGLNYTPGVRVETTCQNCGSQEVRINGLEGNYSQILVDGQPVVGALTKTYGLDQIPINMVDEVDIVRGGSSALYSSSAIGGIINILTKEPENNYYEIKYNLSMIDGKAADNILAVNTTLVDKNKTSGISIFGNMRNRNPWDANGDGFTEIGKNKAGSLGLRSFFKFSSLNKLTAEYHYISEDRRGGDNLDRPPHETEITEWTNYKIHSGALNYDHFFKDKTQRLNVHFSLQDARRDSYFGGGKELNGYGNTSEFTVIGNAKYDINSDYFLFMPTKFTVGLTQSHDLLKNEMPGYNYKQNQNINISTLYFQNEWKDDKLALSVGVRGEKHTLVDGMSIIPRANLRYKFYRNFNFRASYTEGYRAAEITAGDLDIPIQDGKATLLEFAKNIKPERSRSILGGFDTKFFNENFYSYFLVEGFYTHINNAFIDRVYGESETGNTIMIRENANKASVYGINIETSIQPSDHVQIDGGFTMQRGRYKSPEAWSDDETAAPTKDMLRSPNQYGFLTTTFTPNSRVSGSISATYTGKMKVPHLAGYIENDVLETTPRFLDATLKLTYTFNLNAFNKAELSGGIQNVFNQRQKDYDLGVNRDSDYIYGPALPRTFFIGVKIFSI